MSDIFSKDATLLQKITAGLFLAVLGITAYGIYVEILVDYRLFKIFLNIGVGSSAVLMLFAMASLLKAEGRLAKNLERQKQSKVTFFFVILISIPLFSVMFFVEGAPAIIHKLTAEPGELVVQVKRREGLHTEFESDACVKLHGYSNIFNNQICGLHSEDWDAVRPGDKIRLLGQRSFVAFSYEQYQLLDRDE